MHKLVTVFLASAALVGCAEESKQPQADWTKGDGCEKYFSETSREMANCKAYVAALEAKEKEAGVSLDKAGDEVGRRQGIKRAEPTERTLTE